MDGRAAGAGFPIIFGAYLLYSNLSETKLFSKGFKGDSHAAFAALGLFLLVLGLVFLIKNK